jgi:hypothetical protein
VAAIEGEIQVCSSYVLLYELYLVNLLMVVLCAAKQNKNIAAKKSVYYSTSYYFAQSFFMISRKFARNYKILHLWRTFAQRNSLRGMHVFLNCLKVPKRNT